LKLSSLDIIILVPLLIGAWQGYKKGLLLEIVALLSFVLAVLGGIYLLDWGIGFIAEFVQGLEAWLPLIAFILLFIGILLIVNLIGRIVKKAMDLTPLGLLDKLAGMLLGVFKLAFFLSLLVWGAASLEFSLEDSLTAPSLLYTYIEPLAPATFELLLGIFPYGSDILDELSGYFTFV